MFDVNVGAAMGLSRAVAPGMKKAGAGRIVNISSGAGLQASLTGIQAYCSAKHAVVGLTRQLAHELGAFGITVNSILPGFTRTARLDAIFQGRAQRAGSEVREVEADAMRAVPMARFAEPEEIAAVAVFLASPAASYMTGVNLPVDGGRLALG